MEPPRSIRYLLWQSAFLLRVASLLVPKEQRLEWYNEWHAEVWHWIHFLHESGRLGPASKFELAKHLWGAFSDAAWCRWNRETVVRAMHERPRTPRFCIAAIGTAFLVIVVASGFAPTIRSSFSRLPFTEPDRVAELSFHANYVHYYADTLFRLADEWQAKSQTAQQVAGYSWDSASISTYRGALPVNAARISSNFFEVLGNNAALGRIFHPGDEHECRCIVISHELWATGFRRDPAVIGRNVEFYDGTSTIIGVLPQNFRFISPEISVWAVQTNVTKFNFATRTGAVMRLKPGVPLENAVNEFKKFTNESGFRFVDAEVASLKSWIQQGMQVYVVFTLLALAGSGVLLIGRFTRGGLAREHLSSRDRFRWWLFFASKTILLLATCFIFSLEITHRLSLMFTGVVSPVAGPASTWLFLVTTIVAVTWSYRDQTRRCRICLKRLGHEAYVGVPSYQLLDWWGTELVCPVGHGMLHVAETHSSWLAGDEWIQLDDSWKPLFEEEPANYS